MRREAILLASLAAPLMALAAQPDGDVGARIAGSAVAAQSLQGPLDGTWALTDGKRHTLFVFQLVDPASGDGELQGGRRGAVGGALIIAQVRQRSLSCRHRRDRRAGLNLLGRGAG